MTPPPQAVTIGSQDLREDRYSRLRLIPWWDQRKIQDAKILVIGAGALGNEILKNLGLLGFEQIVVVDLDRIEESNLSRAVLFRAEDVGQFKAAAAARGLVSLSAHSRVHSIVGNVMQDCGLGLFAWADVILAGLDNREARLWINRCAWKVNRPWIDGAIEGINGVARAFHPGKPPCYECTLGEKDWELLDRRMSCNLLTRAPDAEGKVATTPTISSIIAGIQAQEAVKLIHGMPTFASQGFVFEGLNHTSYRVEYTENPDCMSHYTLATIVELPQSSNELTLATLLGRARKDLSSEQVSIEFSRDVIYKLVCPECGSVDERFAAVGSVSFAQGRCANDGQMRVVETVHSYSGSEPFGGRPLSSLGLPPFDIFTARCDDREIGYLIQGDRERVLGALSNPGQP